VKNGVQLKSEFTRGQRRWSSSQRTHFVEGYLCFTVTLRTSHLWYSHYSDYQESLQHLIKTMHDSGIGYRRIAYWLNEHGYTTPRGHEFKNTHVFSILKKKKLRDKRLNNINKSRIENMHLIMLETPMILENKNENL